LTHSLKPVDPYALGNHPVSTLEPMKCDENPVSNFAFKCKCNICTATRRAAGRDPAAAASVQPRVGVRRVSGVAGLYKLNPVHPYGLMKAPGFNPRALEGKNRFQILLFKCSNVTCTATAWRKAAESDDLWAVHLASRGRPPLPKAHNHHHHQQQPSAAGAAGSGGGDGVVYGNPHLRPPSAGGVGLGALRSLKLSRKAPR
jgi:hypothetical protein